MGARDVAGRARGRGRRVGAAHAPAGDVVRGARHRVGACPCDPRRRLRRAPREHVHGRPPRRSPTRRAPAAPASCPAGARSGPGAHREGGQGQGRHGDRLRQRHDGARAARGQGLHRRPPSIALRRSGASARSSRGSRRSSATSGRVVATDLRRGEARALPSRSLVLLSSSASPPRCSSPSSSPRARSRGRSDRRLVIAPTDDGDVRAHPRQLIGLGLAIDYSLLVSPVPRGARAPPLRTEDAIVRTISTAGRTVLFSGVAVAIGLRCCCSCPSRSCAPWASADSSFPLVSLAALVTLQPATALLLGGAGARSRLPPERARPARTAGAAAQADVDRGLWARTPSRAMHAAAGRLPRGRRDRAGGGSASCGVAQPSRLARSRAYRRSSRPRAGYDLLRRGIGPGVVTPTPSSSTPAPRARTARMYARRSTGSATASSRTSTFSRSRSGEKPAVRRPDAQATYG